MQPVAQPGILPPIEWPSWQILKTASDALTDRTEITNLHPELHVGNL
jgi:hypothetical protein